MWILSCYLELFGQARSGSPRRELVQDVEVALPLGRNGNETATKQFAALIPRGHRNTHTPNANQHAPERARRKQLMASGASRQTERRARADTRMGPVFLGDSGLLSTGGRRCPRISVKWQHAPDVERREKSLGPVDESSAYIRGAPETPRDCEPPSGVYLPD